MEIKTCAKCGEEKPATSEYYSKLSRNKDGLHARCKVCRNSYEREVVDRMRQDPEWVERKKENLLRHREKGWHNDIRYKRALDLKKEFVEMKGGKCEKCGYNRNLAALDFHHTDPSDKKIRINMNEMAKVNKEDLLREEVEKCNLLCANCHREEHHPTMVI